MSGAVWAADAVALVTCLRNGDIPTLHQILQDADPLGVTLMLATLVRDHVPEEQLRRIGRMAQLEETSA